LGEGDRSHHCDIPVFQTTYLPCNCGAVGSKVAAGVDGLTTKRYKSDPEIRNDSSLFA